jgi:hypothetical protein
MARQLVRKPMSWAKRGPNARSDLGDEKKARALFRSRARHQINPMIATLEGVLWDGNRTHLGWELEGRPDVEMDFITTDEEITPGKLSVMQTNSALHREPLRDADFAVVLRDTLAANPDMTRKEVAEDLFNVDASLLPRYLSFFESIPAVQEAARAGLIGVSDWYLIQRSRDQQRILDKRLKGASRDAIALEIRNEQQDPQAPKERTTRVRIPLASSDGGPTVSGLVTVAGLPGEEVSFVEVEELLKAALKAVKESQKRSLGLKAAQASWKDMANAC